MTANRTRVTALALAAQVPTIYVHGEYVSAGGLISYGANFPDLFRRAAEVVDKLLRGTKPADIPVEQPTKFDLVINLTTAKALGLEVPPTPAVHHAARWRCSRLAALGARAAGRADAAHRRAYELGLRGS